MDPKQERKAFAEALQVASQIRKSGNNYFCAQLNECLGDKGTLIKCLEIMNKTADGKKRLGDTENVGKLLITSNEDKLYVLVYSLDPKISRDWLHGIYDGDVTVTNENDYAGRNVYIGEMLNNPDKSVYVFKLKDELISRGNAYLRENKLIPAPVEDDEDELFGEEVFDAM